MILWLDVATNERPFDRKTRYSLRAPLMNGTSARPTTGLPLCHETTWNGSVISSTLR